MIVNQATAGELAFAIIEGSLKIIHLALVYSAATSIRVTAGQDLLRIQSETDELLSPHIDYACSQRPELEAEENKAGLLSKLTFWWVQPLMSYGYKVNPR